MTKEQKLSDKERILYLEEQVEFLSNLVTEMQKTQASLLKGVTKIIETNKKNEQEMTRWSTAVEERLSLLVVQQANMGLIVNTAIKLTPEQEEHIKSEAERIKDIQKQRKEENMSSK